MTVIVICCAQWLGRGGVGSFFTQFFFVHFLLRQCCSYIYPSGKICLATHMSRKIAKFGPKKSSKRPFHTVKTDRHYFWDAPFRTIPKLVLLLLKWYSNYDSWPCNALLRTFFIWSTYECFYDPKMTQKCKNLIFYATPIKPTFFGHRWTRLNVMIPSPYPEATLVIFGFPVSAHSVARRSV